MSKRSRSQAWTVSAIPQLGYFLGLSAGTKMRDSGAKFSDSELKDFRIGFLDGIQAKSRKSIERKSSDSKKSLTERPSQSKKSTGSAKSQQNSNRAQFYPKSLGELDAKLSTLSERKYLKDDIDRAARVLSSLKTTDADYIYNSIKVSGKLVDIKADENHCWLQIQRQLSAEKIALDIYDMNRRAAIKDKPRIKVGGRDIEKYLTELFFLISNADTIEQSRSSTAVHDDNELEKHTEIKSKIARTLVEDANPGQDSEHFTQARNFPSDYEGKFLRWMGDYLGVEKDFDDNWGFGMRFVLANELMTVNSDPGFRVTEAMARELSKQQRKGYTFRVLFKVEKGDSGLYHFAVISVMFPTPKVGARDWTKITADGRSIRTKDGGDWW